jgi:hypothetical protein
MSKNPNLLGIRTYSNLEKKLTRIPFCRWYNVSLNAIPVMVRELQIVVVLSLKVGIYGRERNEYPTY